MRHAGRIAYGAFTLFPATTMLESNTPTQNDTVTMGIGNERRAWLMSLCQSLLDIALEGEPLLELTTAIHVQLFRQGHGEAQCPQQLRRVNKWKLTEALRAAWSLPKIWPKLNLRESGKIKTKRP